MWSLDRVPLFYQVNSRALMPYTRSFFLFPLILRSCFSLELGFIFHVWVFNRILVFPCLNYSKFLRVPPSPQVGVNLFWSAWITGLLMVELRYCLNTVTRQEQFTSTNAFHSRNLLTFFSFSHVFTIVELRHLINHPWFKLTKGFHSKCPSAFPSTVFQWWQDELFKSTHNTSESFAFQPPTDVVEKFLFKKPFKIFWWR